MNTPSYNTIQTTAAVVLSSVMFTACAINTAPTSQTSPAEAPTKAVTDLYYTVREGDSLASIAKRYTGDTGNWTVIAETNGIADPRKLRVGHRLIVPSFLLLPPANKPSSSTLLSALPPATAIKTPDVEIKKANPNKRFVLTPLGSDASPGAGNATAPLAGSDYIKIVGSYFPKVVYESPRLNAKLLMRVAPGATFPLEKLDDGWYRISTDQGSGYLRLQDGLPTNPNG